MFNNKKILLIVALLAGIGYFFLSGGEKSGSSGKTIRIAVTGQPESLDPSKASGTWTSYILYDAFTGLVEFSPEGELIPGVAESWDISKDGKVYTFKIRENAKWSDGVDVTADDFVFSIQKGANPEEAGKWASLLYVVKGVKDYASGKGSKEDIKAEAIDSKTLKIELEAPVGYFLELLAHYAYAPVPKHVVEEYGNDWVKPGNYQTNGAYKVVEYKAGAYVKAVKNEFHYDADKVEIENVTYFLQDDLTSLAQRFKNNEVEIVRDFPSEQYHALKDQLGEDVVKVAPWLGVYYFTLNLDKITDIKVRQALNMAVDRDFITEKVISVEMTPAYSVMPDNLGNYDSYEYSWVKKPYKERLAMAKKLMEEAGYSENKRLVIELAYNTHEDHKKVAIAAADMFKNIYVDLKLVNREVTTHYATLRSGGFEMGRAGWIADYRDPAAFLQIFLGHSANNYARFDSDKFDENFIQAQQIVDDKARNRVYKELERQVLENHTIIPIYYYSSKSLVSDRVSGWKDNIVDTHLTKYLKLK